MIVVSPKHRLCLVVSLAGGLLAAPCASAGAQTSVEWVGPGGNWFSPPPTGRNGWFCPYPVPCAAPNSPGNVVYIGANPLAWPFASSVRANGAATVGTLVLGLNGGNGSLSVPQGGSVTANLVVGGAASTGALTVTGGGVVTSSGTSVVARAPGSTGRVRVSGPSSAWNATGLLSGLGASIDVQGGGTVRSGGTFLNGITTVAGAGSVWTTDFVELGYGSGNTGTLSLASGAAMHSPGGAFIGTFGATGTVTVTGPGPQWTTPFLEVQTGTLRVQAGGAVDGGATSIGTFVGDNGAVVVDGTGSALQASTLCVGCNDRGTLTVRNGGTVAVSQSAAVGAAVGSAGRVTVDGATWATAGALTIGANGYGAVKVRNGGVMSAGSLTVGSNGTLDIDPAAVTVLGDFSLLPGGTLAIGVSGAAPGLFSQLLVGGVGIFRGDVFVNFMGGFAPAAGQTFSLITAAGGADFSQATVNVGGLAPGFQFASAFANGAWTLTALTNGTAVPEPTSLALVAGGLLALGGVGAWRGAGMRRRAA